MVVREKLLGKEHPILGDNYSGLGWVYYRTNKQKECYEAFTKCSNLYESGFGSDSLITASAYYSYGLVCKWYRKYTDAEM